MAAKVFPSPFFNFEFVRALHAAPFHAADVGECLEAAAKIKDGDPESWYRAWHEAGEKSAALAEEAHAANDKEAERWALLRTWNYIRASESLLHIDYTNPRLLEISERAVDYFRRGIKMLDSEVLILEIPFEQYKMPAYLYLPESSCKIKGKTPLIIQTAGFDSSQEELYLFVAAGAIKRGYAVLTFDGPGQGLMLRRHGTTLRPDWEVVTSAVIDYVYDLVKERPDLNLDLDRLTITGNSMGGYFVMRGAADPRVKACISTDGFYDVWLIAQTRLPGWFVSGWESGWIPDWVVNNIVYAGSKLNFQMAWEFYHSMWVFGVDSPANVFRQWKRYVLKTSEGEKWIPKIKCPVMVTGAADTIYFPPPISTKLIYDDLELFNNQGRKLWIAEGVGQGGMQAKIGAMAIAHQKMFAWLDNIFKVERQVTEK